MVYCLSIIIVTDEQSVIDALKAKVKAKTDAQLWQDDVGWDKRSFTNDEGNLVLMGTMRFLNEADQTTALDWMKSKAALYKPLLYGKDRDIFGSSVVAHTCNHKKILEGTNIPGNNCTITYEWYKN